MNAMWKPPEDIKIHLDKIANYIWHQRAMLMVGAGLSQNARLATPNTKPAALWSELSYDLSLALYGQSRAVKKSIGKTSLQLAEEYEKEFGRAALNSFLEEHIDDKNLLPGPLHKAFMEFPWRDIFTTNYDTLLERTTRDILFKKYDVVFCPEDLPITQQPRIIKLHGSFDSHYPFIFTEEDYRKYPRTHSPFVNTVQQGLMENILCLIGFSSNDPNFQQWIGWVRDNLREHTPPIYLIGYLDISSSERKVLEQKNIVPIHISDDTFGSSSYCRALELFVSYIQNHKPENPLVWRGTTTTTKIGDLRNITLAEIENIMNEWETGRKKYPGWLILPCDSRNSLFQDIQSYFPYFDKFKDLHSPLDINTLFEFNWRLEKALYPIPNQFIDDYHNILYRYNPFKISLQEFLGAKSPDTDETIDWSIITKKWLAIAFAILRWSREEAKNDEFQKYHDFLKEIVTPYLHWAHRLHYETISFYISTWNNKAITQELSTWDALPSDLEWDVRRCGILIELGYAEQAKNLLENTLTEIHRREPLGNFITDYSMFSLEGELILLSFGLLSFSQKDFLERRAQYNERCKQLKEYKSSIQEELHALEVDLSIPIEIPQTEIRTRIFDKISETHQFMTALPKQYDTALTAVRFLEETASFSVVSLKLIKNIISRIKIFTPQWTRYVMSRASGKSEDYEEAFSLSVIARIPGEQINILLEEYIQALNTTLDCDIPSPNTIVFRSNYYLRKISFLAEMTSRMLMKASPDNAQKAIEVFCRLYMFFIKSNHYNQIKDIKEVFNRFFRYCSCTAVQNVNVLYDLPFNPDSYSKDILSDFDLLSLCIHKEKTSISNTIIEKLLTTVASSDSHLREAAVLRLFQLQSADLLSIEQGQDFANKLLDQKDSNTGFPQVTGVNIFIYAKILPKGKDLLKHYFLESEICLVTEKELEGQFSLGCCVNNLISADVIFSKIPINQGRYYIDLSTDEVNNLFVKIKESWDKIKNKVDQLYISAEGKSFIDERFWDDRFESFTEFIVDVLVPYKDCITNISELLHMLDEIIATPIPHLKLELAKAALDSSASCSWKNAILQGLYSLTKQSICESTNAIKLLCAYKKLGIDVGASREFMPAVISALFVRNAEWFRDVVSTFIAIIDGDSDFTINEYEPVLYLLENLIEDTSFDNFESPIEQEQRILLRIGGGMIARELYKKLLSSKSDIPSVILAWKNLKDNTEEISIIREIWDSAN